MSAIIIIHIICGKFPITTNKCIPKPAIHGIKMLRTMIHGCLKSSYDFNIMVAKVLSMANKKLAKTHEFIATSILESAIKSSLFQTENISVPSFQFKGLDPFELTGFHFGPQDEMIVEFADPN